LPTLLENLQMDIVNLHNDKKSDFSRVYSIYFPKLVRFAREFVLSTEDAENIIQDIFIYLWEHQEILGSLSNLNAFLFVLVKNRCIDFIRQKKLVERKREEFEMVMDKELQLKMYALQQFDENALSADDIEVILNNAINSLPEKCREVFILSRMEGLKYREIAERLNISTKTVENQIITALRKLRVELKDYLPLFIFII
jgi:RNA polymerase sigma-70 factor (ECF subfamily)